MNKIRIIDLLNKIANGEQPKKIKYRNIIYNFEECKGNVGYINKDYGRYRWFVKEIECDLENGLNDEVEILEEEKKIPEKLGYFDLTKDKNEKDENGNDLELHYTGVADTFDDVYEKINDILDYLDYLDYLKSKGE